MRVNPYYVSNLVSALNQTQVDQQNLTQELSSGVRVTSLSADPVAAGGNVLLLNQIQKDDSFSLSSSVVTGQLQVADTALGSVVTQLTQAISLATSGNNGTLNSSQLKSISSQLAGIRDEVQSLANTSYLGITFFPEARQALYLLRHPHQPLTLPPTMAMAASIICRLQMDRPFN